jgi:arabinose-5-phosphate isomerase
MHAKETPIIFDHQKVAELLRVEAAAIERAADRLDAATVVKALEILANCAGTVIVSGVGKSGVIAQKIAQTMTSTGTVAIFVHPSDAMHGSLGSIRQGDVFIALSNSGETEELLSLFPTLKGRQIPLISITGNLESSMAIQSDVALDASVDREACPLNLAPTTSTTVALAIGDALAMALMEAKGLTQEDFASNHPAGRLGKRLTVRVESLMHESPNVSPSAGWLEVIKGISTASLGAVNVIESDGRLLGIITDGDLRRTIEKTSPELFARLSAEQMMTASPVTAGAGMLAYEALRLMEDRDSQISVLPVVDANGQCVGLLRLHDIVRSGV